MPAILTQGITDIREAVRTLVTHVGVATDATTFAAAQTAIDPANAGSTNYLIKPATKTVIDFQTMDYTMTIDGNTEFTNKSIMTISILKGALRTNAITRSVRGAGLGIGVQAGDLLTVGVRDRTQDDTA